MELGFSGEVAALYHLFRRGYPAAVIGVVVDTFCLSGNDLVVDLGCGTGQLATPMAHRVRAVIGIDPEPDVLACACSAAQAQGATNMAWMIGQDVDIPMLQSVLGAQTVGAVTIGQALHWMDHEALFSALVPLIRRDGGVAVLTNGLPLWLQDSEWSRVLREWLQDWLGVQLEDSCGTDAAAQHRYRNSMSRNGYELHELQIDYTDELDLDRIVGGVYSALPASQLPPPDERSQIAAQLRRVLEPHQPFIEHRPRQSADRQAAHLNDRDVGRRPCNRATIRTRRRVRGVLKPRQRPIASPYPTRLWRRHDKADAAGIAALRGPEGRAPADPKTGRKLGQHAGQHRRAR